MLIHLFVYLTVSLSRLLLANVLSDRTVSCHAEEEVPGDL